MELGSGQIRASNYVAQLSGLKASTRYKYRIGDGFTWSEELWFVTSPDAATLETSLPHRFMIYGDLAGTIYV